jgi:hypothetical protein
MLLLLIVGNYKLCGWIEITWCKIQIKFRESCFSGSKNERLQIHVNLLKTFPLRKGSRLEMDTLIKE